jgi:hypothetical protein
LPAKAGPENTCWENASKTISDFALAVDQESFTNSKRKDTVARAVIIPSMTFPEGGSTEDD